tara:strand:- start:866 stop:1474 length:609 start_codon:yes stop_codon:yes gene_type:complete
MRYFRVQLSGRGGETVCGSLTEEQYHFWKDLEESDIINHAFDDPYEENDTNPVFDPEDPRFLGYWNELDDLYHGNAVTADSCYITITEVNSVDYQATDIAELVDQSWTEFEAEHTPDCDEEDEEDPGDAQYGFTGYSDEKGTFAECLIQTDGDFDIAKLKFCLTLNPNSDTILEIIEYNGEDVDIDYGDTTGKGYYASIWEN